MFNLFLYGIANAESKYRVVCYEGMEIGPRVIDDVKEAAARMIHNPSVDSIYVINWHPGLKSEYTRTWRTNTIESNVTFKVMLEKQGIKVV